MHLTRGVLVTMFLAGAPAGTSAQDLPLSADVIAITDRAAEYVLSNHGTKIATAWAIAFTSRDSADNRHEGAITEDYYLSLEFQQFNGHTGSNALGPAESRRLTSEGGYTHGSVLTGVDAHVAAVVFADGSSVGAVAIIDEIFAYRRASRDTYAALMKDVQTAKSNAGPAEVLEALALRTTAQRGSYPQPVLAESFLHDLASARARIERGTLDAAQALQTVEMMVSIHYAAAAKHSIRAK